METPCIDICVIDPETRECEGCFRTADQITNWTSYSKSEREEVMAYVRRKRAASDQTIPPQEHRGRSTRQRTRSTG